MSKNCDPRSLHLTVMAQVLEGPPNASCVQRWRFRRVTGSWGAVSSVDSTEACVFRQWGWSEETVSWAVRWKGASLSLHSLLLGCHEACRCPLPGPSCLGAGQGLSPLKLWDEVNTPPLHCKCQVFYPSDRKMINTEHNHLFFKNPIDIVHQNEANLLSLPGKCFSPFCATIIEYLRLGS